MRRFILFLSLLSCTILVKAQFGYYSNSNVNQMLPMYRQAASDYERLCKRCEKEIEHNERELTRKYVAFLDGYRDFPEPILRKRQNELQRLVDNSVNFRKELKSWLAEAKDSLFAPSREAIAVAVEKVSQACDLDYVIDLDVAAYRYINPNKGVDITTMLLDAILYPEKPVTEIDGYDIYMKMFKPEEMIVPSTPLVEAEVVSETVVPSDTTSVISGEDVVVETEGIATATSAVDVRE